MHSQHRLRKRLPDLIQLPFLNRATKLTNKDIVAQREKLRRHGRRAGVLGREASDGERRLAVGVHLRVERPLVEDGHLQRPELRADHARVVLGVEDAAFGDGLGVDAACGDSEELGTAGVNVGRDDAAGCRMLVFRCSRGEGVKGIEDGVATDLGFRQRPWRRLRQRGRGRTCCRQSLYPTR